MTNQTAEAFEEVAPGDIEQALERQRVQGENGGGAVVRASVANLVVVTPTGPPASGPWPRSRSWGRAPPRAAWS